MGIEDTKYPILNSLINYISNKSADDAFKKEAHRLSKNKFKEGKLSLNETNFLKLEKNWITAGSIFEHTWMTVEKLLSEISKTSKLRNDDGEVIIDFNDFPKNEASVINNYLNTLGKLVDKFKDFDIHSFIRMNLRNHGLAYMELSDIYNFITLDKPFDQLFGFPLFLDYSITTNRSQQRVRNPYSFIFPYAPAYDKGIIITMKSVYSRYIKDLKQHTLKSYRAMQESGYETEKMEEERMEAEEKYSSMELSKKSYYKHQNKKKKPTNVRRRKK